MTQNKLTIDPINDTTDKDFITHTLFNLPMRIAIVGKSQLSGKTSLLINLIAKDEGYKALFLPENIFIVSPSIHTEKFAKFIKYMKIPSSNLFITFNNLELSELYKILKDEHESTENENKQHKLIIFDDIGFTGKLSSSAQKTDNIMDLLMCNGRHQLISVIVIAQKYTQLSTCIRENLTGLIMFECSNQQLESLEQEHNSITTKKDFFIKFREATKEPHSFFTINYNRPPNLRYFKGLEEQILF